MASSWVDTASLDEVAAAYEGETVLVQFPMAIAAVQERAVELLALAQGVQWLLLALHEPVQAAV